MVRVELVVGPTGSGKSERADALASLTGAPIVVADRFQCLRELPVSTARPVATEVSLRRIFLGERALADGPLSGRDACAALLSVIGALSDDHEVVVVEGGSLSMAAALREFDVLPFDLRVHRRSIGSRSAHLARLTQRARAMIAPPSPLDAGLLDEIARAWRDPAQRRWLRTVNGPEAVLDWCRSQNLCPGDLTTGVLTPEHLDSLVSAVAEAHLFHALDQERSFAVLFPDAVVEPCDDEPTAATTTTATESPCVAVVCGARDGADPRYLDAATELGRMLADEGYEVCYGGASIGLMGAVADGALGAGGAVVGVIPRHLMDYEIGHPGLTRQHVVPTMAERKSVMLAYSDVVVALPGGLGTLDELFEFATTTQLGLSRTVCVLVDVAGFWAPLITLVRHLFDHGFISRIDLDRFVVVDSPGAAVRAVERVLSDAGAARAGVPA